MEDGDETIHIINGAELELVSNQDTPISAQQGIRIDGSTVTATTNDDSHQALYTYEGGIKINNSTVKAYAESSSSAAVRAGVSSVEITGDSDVTATGLYGIYAYSDISISGGKVTATGTDGNGSIGISSNMGKVVITGGEVTAAGGDTTGSDAGSVGINAIGVSVTGGTVIATGGAATGDGAVSIGMSTLNESILISGGKVEAAGGSEAVQAFYEVIVSPQDGKGIKVTAGETASGAAEINGSPFTAETEITSLVANKKYFRSEAVEVTSPAAADIYVGGIGLTGTADDPACALTDADGAVMTTGAAEDNYNIKWDGSTLTLNSAKITQDSYVFFTTKRPPSTVKPVLPLN